MDTPDKAQVEDYYRSLALLQSAMTAYLNKYLSINSLPIRDDVIDEMFVSLIAGTPVASGSQALVRQYVDILFVNGTISNAFKTAISMKVLMLSASGMGSDGMQIVRNLLSYGIRAMQLDSKVPESIPEFSRVVNKAVSMINDLAVPVATAKLVQPFLANGRYTILECIGKGGYGTVHKAHDTKLNRHIAVKHLSLQTGLPHEKRFIRDLEREAMSMAGFSHPNIVQVHDFLEDESGCYILMEYAERGTLHDLLEKNNGTLCLNQFDQIRFYDGLFEGLSCAHQKGVIHRDIKPSNILICSGRDIIPKYADFGISSCIGTIASSAGTPLYMAPELRGTLQHVADPVVDIYSLGKVIYECLTGEVGLAISDAHESLAPGLNTVLATACAYDPHMRYKTVEEMQRAFGNAYL